MRKFRDFFQHRFNPLHFYCLLMELGCPGKAARSIAGVYENLLTPVLYGGVRN